MQCRIKGLRKGNDRWRREWLGLARELNASQGPRCEEITVRNMKGRLLNGKLKELFNGQIWLLLLGLLKKNKDKLSLHLHCSFIFQFDFFYWHDSIMPLPSFTINSVSHPKINCVNFCYTYPRAFCVAEKEFKGVTEPKSPKISLTWWKGCQAHVPWSILLYPFNCP